MSDPPPVKPKPGSLRDRIAAFEQKPAASSGLAPPAPRPKPGGLSKWAPRPASPPASPPAATRHEGGGMSASDAKESITKAGSLKDRMAALQGLGAFGGGGPSASTPPPKPAEKPKWKPPPQVVMSPPIGGDDDDADAAPAASAKVVSPFPTPGEEPPVIQAKSPPPTAEGVPEGEEGATEEGEKEVDAEEEERQRRAAIAARMAKLGGARVGMGPPVFGRKPEIKKPSVPTPKSDEEEKPKLETPASEGDHKVQTPEIKESLDVPSVKSPPEETTETAASSKPQTPSDYFPLQASPSPSASPAPSPSIAPRSMPVPAGPRRAAPPRKKPTPKSSSTPSVPETAPAPVLNSGEVLHDSPATADVDAPVPAEILQGDREPEIGVVNPSVEAGGSIPASTEESVALEPPDDQEAPSTTSSSSEPRPGSEDDPEVYLKPKHDIDTVPELAPEPSSPLAAEPTAHEVPALQETSHDAEVQEDDVNSREENPSEEQLDVPQEPTALAEDEEEDEEARRKRIAERVAKMGGFNPFGSQPVASPPAVSPPSALPPTPFAIDSPLSFKTVTSPPEEDVPTIGGVQNDIDVEIPPSMTRKDSASSESPEVTRKKSSSSVPIPYGVMQQGGPANPSEEEEEDDEDDEGHDPDLHDRAQSSSTEEQEPAFVSSRQEEGASDVEGQQEVQIDHDGENYAAQTRALHEADVEAGAEPYASPEEAREDDDEGRDDRAADDGAVSAVRTPLAPEDPSFTANDEHSLEEPDDDEMAPPRITRPLPSAPAHPHAVLISSLPQHIPPVPTTPVASKRQSVPPPARPVPIPGASASDAAPARQESVSLLRRSSTKRTSMPPPSRVPPTPTVETSDPIVEDGQITHEPEEIAHEEPAPPTPLHRKPSVPPPYPSSPSRAASTTENRRTSSDSRRSAESRRSHDGKRSSFQVSSSPPPAVLPVIPSSPSIPSHYRELSASHTKRVPPALEEPLEREQEVLDESDGDPIDPRFHSPPAKSPGKSPVFMVPAAPPPSAADTVASPPSSAAPREPPVEEGEEDVEQARRRTIAERMAKLGGIKFGAPPPPPLRRPPASATQNTEEASGEQEAPAMSPNEPVESAPVEEEGEEDEQARRQRIAAKLAGMGGMRFGMLPTQPNVGPNRQTTRREDETAPTPAAPPLRTQAPPPADSDHELESNVSDDGVQVEAEESELEEVHHADAEDDYEAEEEEEEEEAPPPPPRVGSHRPPVPLGRPPVPPPVRKPSVDVQSRPPRNDSYDTVTSPTPRPPYQQVQSDFVMVDKSDEGSPPPSRPSRGPPRGIPPPPPPETVDTASTGQWELPSIPTGALDFGDSGASDLSASMTWSEDSTAYPSTAPSSNINAPPPPPPVDRSKRMSTQPHPEPGPPQVPRDTRPRVPSSMSPEELKAVSNRVGAQICDTATALLERSRRTLVGNGSYAGFLSAVFAMVPSAQPPLSPTEYGYLVYAQTGGMVHTRASDIMPGDVIVLEDARLKGHKGLHAYSMSAGEGTPCLGVVSDFEAKKMKVKALQANQHVGQATVESVSYRLEDLKSGSIKVYRVLEA